MIVDCAAAEDTDPEYAEQGWDSQIDLNEVLDRVAVGYASQEQGGAQAIQFPK